MQIRPTNNLQSTSAVNLNTQNTTQSANAAESAPVDQLEISAEAQMMSATSTNTEIRTGLVENIRAQIASGQYDTPEKLDVALSRMLNELA